MSKKPNKNWSSAKGRRHGHPRPQRPARERRPHDASLSLMEFAAPLIDALGDEGVAEALVDAALLWNVAVHEHVFGGRSAAESYLDDGLPPGAAPELLDAYAAVLQRKRDETPFDARWIGALDVRPDGSGFAVRAEWAPPDAVTREVADTILSAFSGAAPVLEPTELQVLEGLKREFSSEVLAADGVDVWTSILESAKEIEALAPWDSHGEQDVFGIRIDGEPEVHWCCVMGSAGEFPGVALYRGAQGFDDLKKLTLDGDSETALAGFDGFLLSFNDREDLTAAERRRIKDAGVRFRGRGAWPKLHLHTRGRLPIELSREDEERSGPLMKALSLVLEARCCGGVPLDVDLDGELPVYEFGAEEFALRFELPGAPAEVDLPPVDRVGVARLLGATDRADVALEFGGIAMPARVEDDDGLEFIPFLFLATDAVTGILLQPRIAKIGTREAECAAHLLGMLSEASLLPREIHVASDWIERAIAPTAEALSVRVVRSGEMPMFEQAAASMVSFMEAQD